MIQNIGPQAPQLSRGNLVMYDQFNKWIVQSVMIQRGGARSFVFPVLPLVKRWIYLPRLNHGVYIMLHPDHPGDDNQGSINVKMDSPGAAIVNRPLLVVQTQSKSQKVEALSFGTR